MGKWDWSKNISDGLGCMDNSANMAWTRRFRVVGLRVDLHAIVFLAGSLAPSGSPCEGWFACGVGLTMVSIGLRIAVRGMIPVCIL